MNESARIADFVNGECEALNRPKWFIEKWYDTGGKPCLKCGTDKSKCEFNKVLIERKNI